jgi:phthalate 3,4-dioxygenase subunit beta
MSKVSLAVAPARSLPFSDMRHQEALQFLVDEAYLLDAQEYEAWLELLTDDVQYLMPLRVTTARGAGSDLAQGMSHFDEDKFSLGRRVARFATEHAWTEDPPSRLRHHLSNVRAFATANSNELRVQSAVLLFRSRGDVREAEWLSVGRDDVLRCEGGRWLLARRLIMVDEAVLRMQNLAIFL